MFIILCSTSVMAQQSWEQALNPAADRSVSVKSATISKVNGRLLVAFCVEVNENVDSNQSLVLQPEISDSLGNFVTIPAIFVNGRRQQIYRERNLTGGTDGNVLLRKKKNSALVYNYVHTLSYEKWMNGASLYLREQNCGCNIIIENGVAWLDKMEDTKTFAPILHFIVPKVETRKIREEKGTAYLQFPVNKSLIKSEFNGNKIELRKILNTVNLVRNDTMVRIQSINIHGYASPDGPYENNKRLGYERTMALKKYLNNLYCFDDSVVHCSSTVEDWDGFIKMLNDSVCPQKENMLAIARGRLSPDMKEKKLKKSTPEGFRFVAEKWFPLLRRTEYAVSYIVRPFSDDEAKREFLFNPKNLSIDEMYQLAATYPQGSDQYNYVFKKAASLFPDDVTANYNAACISLKEGNTEEAAQYLEHVPDMPQKKNAVGVLLMLQGKRAEAVEMLRAADEEHAEGASENLLQLE